ncbi:MAG: sodium:solute symporter [Bacteroidota bacterium]
MSFIDWSIVVLVLAFLVSGVIISKKYMRSVADFLAAGRTAGRYVVSMSQGMAMLGAISIVGLLELNYVAGFNMNWWRLSEIIVVVAITVSGWVIYRFRQTRALTMAQFFEIRYSRNFRVFAGLLAFFSGIINFGIFPSVGARFFIYFCGIPQSFNIAGLEISSYPILMLILLGIALYFVFAGGQIAVIITDFIQGILVNSIFILIVLYFIITIDWETIFITLSQAPENASLVNPFKTSHVEDFNVWFFIIGLIGLIYGKLSWQGTQAYNSSARTAHEAKMGEVLSNWRNIPQWNLFVVFVPIIAYTVMHSDLFSIASSSVQSTLDSIDSEVIQNQMRIPLVLAEILPIGLVGAFAAIMLAAFISTHDTYLHSWGSIFIQDIIMPFRKKPFSQEDHIKVLKYSIIGVAVFVFMFSLIFKQSEYIFLFFAITGAIFTGGSGAVIIGGLYWKRGTTAGAWSALITGSVVAVGGIIIHQIWEDFFINGQMFWGLAMGISALVYIIVSLLGGKKEFNMDKMLHRGEYEIEDEIKVIEKVEKRGWKIFGMGKEFTRGDKIIYIGTYAWTITWVLVFIFGTVYNLSTEVDDASWMSFWKVYIYANIGASILAIVWFTIGGIKDVKRMFKQLGSMERDTYDDGTVSK